MKMNVKPDLFSVVHTTPPHSASFADHFCAPLAPGWAAAAVTPLGGSSRRARPPRCPENVSVLELTSYRVCAPAVISGKDLLVKGQLFLLLL